MVEDEVRISRAQAGDEEAFAELMRAYYAYVYTVVIKIVSNPHDAEEVVQETFFSAYRGLPQLEDRRKFKGWLAEIARNRARNWRRSQKVDTVSIDDVGEHTLQVPDAVDDELIRDEQRELIRRAMETLSDKDREIAHSYYLDGASYDELIQTHGLSYKAISFRLSRAKQRLAKRLQHLLTGLSVPPATTLKQLYSGGLTVMKIGTGPKITMAAIGIVALIFIGSHQFLSSKDKHPASIEAVGQTSDTAAQSVTRPDVTRRGAPNTDATETQRTISDEDMAQIKRFFGQFEESGTPSETERSTEQLNPIPQSVIPGPPDREQIVAKIQELEAESTAIREQYLGLIDMTNELRRYGHWHNDNAGVLEQIHAVNDAEPGTDEAAAERVRTKAMEIIDKFNTEQQDIVDTINDLREETNTLISQRNSILTEIAKLKASVGEK